MKKFILYTPRNTNPTKIATRLILALFILGGMGSASAQAAHSAGTITCPNVDGFHLEIELDAGWTKAVQRKWNGQALTKGACPAKNFGTIRNIIMLNCTTTEYGEDFESRLRFSNPSEKRSFTATFMKKVSYHQSRGPFYLGLNKAEYLHFKTPVECTFTKKD
jgi:hypothetical protein